MVVSAKIIIDKAESFVGTKESPPNSNNVIFNTDYYGKPVSGAAYPWCAVFLWDIFRMCNASDLFYGGQKCAYTPTLYNYYKSLNRAYATPKPGDLVFFKFKGSNRINHVGLVKEVKSGGKIVTIEGNTSMGNQSNGGEVMIRERTNTYVVGYGRPLYTESPYDPSNIAPSINGNTSSYQAKDFIKEVQKILGVPETGIADVNLLALTVTISKKINNKHPLVVPLQKYLKAMNYYTSKVDGEAGPLFDAATKKFQKSFLRNPDGEFTAGGTSWKKILNL